MMQTKIFEPVPTERMQSVPSPWSGVDAGETWAWGDFFMIFEKRPSAWIEVVHRKAKVPGPNLGLIYHYAMTVFYHAKRNPHGWDYRESPIIIATLEQSDTSVTARRLGFNNASGGMSPLFLGLFCSQGHLNFGEYNGANTPDAVKNIFFKMVGQHLELNGQPRWLGTAVQAYDNPATGLPRTGYGNSPTIGKTLSKWWNDIMG